MRKVAGIISIVGHPLLTIPLFVMIVMFGSEVFSKAALNSLLIVGGVFIPLVLWLYVKSKNGTITNFDVSDQSQRKSLFWVAVPLLTIVTVVLFVTHQSRNLCMSVLFALLLVVISQVINLFVKSSLHTSLNIYLSALVFTVDYKMGIAVLLFTGLISWSRVKLGRHTVKEVVVGLAIGIFISLIMLKVEGYMNI
jgi:membrane-associated phospholipid phosphatase